MPNFQKKIRATGLSCHPEVNPGRPIDLKGQFIQDLHAS